jgi:phospholipase/carboxylesterase
MVRPVGVVDQVIPITWARKTTNFDTLGMNLSIKEYPIGHGISPQILLISKLV